MLWPVLVVLIGGGLTLSAGAVFGTAVLFAITIVVITCPDALGPATPTAIMVGTRMGATCGVLFKNAMTLETSARIQAVVMDKTGALTKGEPEVTDVPTALRIGRGTLRKMRQNLGWAIGYNTIAGKAWIDGGYRPYFIEHATAWPASTRSCLPPPKP